MFYIKYPWKKFSSEFNSKYGPIPKQIIHFGFVYLLLLFGHVNCITMVLCCFVARKLGINMIANFLASVSILA
jgi:hypothetical protein